MQTKIRNTIRNTWFAAIPFGATALIANEQRFPRPEFETDYSIPQASLPQPDSNLLQTVDVVVLLVAMGLVAWLVLHKRSRRWTFTVMAACLVYFGFIRKGCVCSIGSIQNVGLGLFDAGYVLPLTVLLFFLAPLLVALLFGRVFCGAVCPLGAIQDLVVWKPIRVPDWLESGLRFIAIVYLATALLLAINGVGFLICQFDPFVGFFRRSGSFAMLTFGAVLLGIGVFIARPYCRYLCPYGVLLSWLSPISWKHVRITPDECINCRLCETACPFGAIRKPTPPDKNPVPGLPRFVRLLVLIPVLLIVGVGIGRYAGVGLAKFHAAPRLIHQFNTQAADQDPAIEVDAFQKGERTVRELTAQAVAVTARMRRGGGIAGGFLGLMLGLQLAGTAMRRQRSTYTIDRGRCLSCARCFASCPQEQLRLKKESNTR